MQTLSGERPPESMPVRSRAARRNRRPCGPERPAGNDALAPPRVSRAELRRIFEPHDANRVPHWAETGFRDPSLLGGRPRVTYLHLLALVLAAGADIGAFVQVVELVLTRVRPGRSSSWWLASPRWCSTSRT